MNITSRYSDIPEVVIDESKIPAEVLPLLPLAREWSISDDVELEAFIAAASAEKRREFYEAFRPHFPTLAKWREGVYSSILPVGSSVNDFHKSAENTMFSA